LQLRPGDVLHPNAEGHRRLAASIQEFLAAERYFPTATAHDSPAATN
jgi:lysophospholipase L1-like esterase